MKDNHSMAELVWLFFHKAIIPMLVIILVFWRFYDYATFISKGSRFTALDGQMLCHRVQRLEINAFNKSALCDYLTKSPAEQARRGSIDESDKEMKRLQEGMNSIKTAPSIQKGTNK